MRFRVGHLIQLSLVVGTLAVAGCSSSRYERSTGRVVDDATITAKVKTDLLRDPMVKGTEINVDTYRGVVQLNGFVDSQNQIADAVSIAKKVDGVRSVENNLQIKPEAAGAQP